MTVKENSTSNMNTTLSNKLLFYYKNYLWSSCTPPKNTNIYQIIYQPMADPKKEYTAQELAKINKLLGAIDTDEWLEWGVEDISNEEMEQLAKIIFANKSNENTSSDNS